MTWESRRCQTTNRLNSGAAIVYRNSVYNNTRSFSLIFTFLPNDKTFFKYIAPEWDILYEVKVTQIQGKQEDLGLKQDMNLFLDCAKKTQGRRSAEQGSEVGQASVGFPSLSRPVSSETCEGHRQTKFREQVQGQDLQFRVASQEMIQIYILDPNTGSQRIVRTGLAEI